MKIIGLTRIRNEEAIIKETLDHMAEFCSTVIVYDDCSTDKTAEICENHPIVSKVIYGKTWDQNRWNAEFQNRHALYIEAKSILEPNDWFVYMDADERIEFDGWDLLNPGIDVINMRLFDFYITEEDAHLDYKSRTKMGPEYRDIPMIFRMGAATGWHYPDQRICSMIPGAKIVNAGYVKHYGKSISISEWESTSDYYIKYFPNYSEKWKKRKGKAIHSNLSDFDRPLITWDQKDDTTKIVKIG